MCLKVIITVFRVQNGLRVFNVSHAFQECKNKLNEKHKQKHHLSVISLPPPKILNLYNKIVSTCEKINFKKNLFLLKKPQTKKPTAFLNFCSNMTLSL